MTEDVRGWGEAWQDALYGRDGFYRRTEGPAGHFATSAQGIPGVAEILAQAVAALAERHGAEVVVDFACGRGELLSLLAHIVEDDVTLVGVDVVERPDDLEPRIEWLRSPGGAAVPPLDLLDGRRAFVVAHEWLDVVPCAIAEADDAGVLHEVRVAPNGDESLGAAPSEDDLAWATQFAPPRGTAPYEPGERLEIGRLRDAAWANLVAAVRRHAAPGSAVLGVDYAHTATTRNPLGTLTGFRDGGECPPRPDGSCDITSHVMLDSLDLTVAPTTQREVLLDLFGAEPLTPVPISLASSDPQAYLARLATRSAFAAAVDRDGLGSFAWFVHVVQDADSAALRAR